MEEIFRDIKGAEGNYMVSNKGNVLSLHFGKTGKPGLLSPKPNRGGKYRSVDIRLNNGEKKTLLVHRLVAEAFLPNPGNLEQINHKDEDGTNNKVDNLEWCSRSYNCSYGHRMDNIKKANSRAVIQYTLDGKFVKEWNSASEASRAMCGHYSSSIKDCCKGILSSCFGFKWGYKESHWERGL